jgi:Mn2+/Fe2+ NRAMP family transporter
VAIVGTTIAPWQVFFQQSCVVDKGLGPVDMPMARLDTFLGALFTIAVAGCMMFVGSYAHNLGIVFSDPASMALALGPTLGKIVAVGVPLLMVNAAILGATAISLTSAWAYGEVMGWPHSLTKTVKEAPKFYGVTALCIIGAAGLVLIPMLPLQSIIVGVQVFAGLLLPTTLVFLQLMLEDRNFLPMRFRNTRGNRWVNWIIIGALTVLSLILVGQGVSLM